MVDKRNIGDELIQSMEESVEYMHRKKTKVAVHKVEIPDKIDVKSIRKNLNLSRPEFANQFGFSPRTLQHWEQGSRSPAGAAKVLLILLQREPETIEKILHLEIKSSSNKNHSLSSTRKVKHTKSHEVMHKEKF
jgi:putative transcriptional regulator